MKVYNEQSDKRLSEQLKQILKKMREKRNLKKKENVNIIKE